jgi:predicted dehydrogenase
MKEIRVGLIGTGMISHRHMMIYSNIAELTAPLGYTAKVVAAAEIVPERLRAWGAQYGLDPADLYLDYRELLQRDDLDTIDVCVHNNLHTPIAIEAMKAGFDVYCEKPSAASYHDAKLMMDCAAKLGRKYHVQISSIMNAQSRTARDMIARGDLGTPYFVNLEQCAARRRPGYDIPFFGTDFYSKRIAGHGPSIDMGVYAIGQVLFLLGNPEVQSVNGFAGRHVELDDRLVTNPDGFGVEDTVDGFVKFTSGVGFHFLAMSAANYKDYGMTYVLGSKGGLEIIDTDMAGGPYARQLGTPPLFGGEPELRFRGDLGGRDVKSDLACYDNGVTEQRVNPAILPYNDNQAMWLAYQAGLLTEETRYNTPELALRQLLITDGIFLSQELGRSVTPDEIIATSPALYLKEQEIGGKLHRFDVEF